MFLSEKFFKIQFSRRYKSFCYYKSHYSLFHKDDDSMVLRIFNSIKESRKELCWFSCPKVITRVFLVLKFMFFYTEKVIVRSNDFLPPQKMTLPHFGKTSNHDSYTLVWNLLFLENSLKPILFWYGWQEHKF